MDTDRESLLISESHPLSRTPPETLQSDSCTCVAIWFRDVNGQPRTVGQTQRLHYASPLHWTQRTLKFAAHAMRATDQQISDIILWEPNSHSSILLYLNTLFGCNQTEFHGLLLDRQQWNLEHPEAHNQEPSRHQLSPNY